MDILQGIGRVQKKIFELSQDLEHELSEKERERIRFELTCLRDQLERECNYIKNYITDFIEEYEDEKQRQRNWEIEMYDRCGYLD